jgi:GMC oxidoreductase
VEPSIFLEKIIVPKTSVLNKFNRSWDVQNLFVPDGSFFVSQGYQNITLTYGFDGPLEQPQKESL